MIVNILLSLLKIKNIIKLKLIIKEEIVKLLKKKL
jgi:hypothetical protein